VLDAALLFVVETFKRNTGCSVGGDSFVISLFAQHSLKLFCQLEEKKESE